MRPGSFGAAVVLISALAAAGLPAAVDACTCAAARLVNGWCDVHDQGFVAGLTVRSRWLYEAADAHGHQVDLSTFNCPSCQRAIAASGYCETHRIGFVHDLAYFSRLTYELAKGEARSPESIGCATCRKNSETYGWCDKSKIGMVGPFALRDRAGYERAIAAYKVFEIANATAARCRYCAVAIITDTECPVCKIAYKDGKAVRVP